MGGHAQRHRHLFRINAMSNPSAPMLSILTGSWQGFTAQPHGNEMPGWIRSKSPISSTGLRCAAKKRCRSFTLWNQRKVHFKHAIGKDLPCFKVAKKAVIMTAPVPFLIESYEQNGKLYEAQLTLRRNFIRASQSRRVFQLA